MPTIEEISAVFSDMIQPGLDLVKAEPICTYYETTPRANRRGGGASVWLKKLTNRVMRRLAKRDPEEAPRKRRFLGFFW